mmetsp:Transcript_17241/g.30944  ORF Transcript_17241/g.30944 Transcript_17241/m.30944 type:complete len:230 (+) Transcript_17241:104-793(+)
MVRLHHLVHFAQEVLVLLRGPQLFPPGKAKAIIERGHINDYSTSSSLVRLLFSMLLFSMLMFSMLIFGVELCVVTRRPPPQLHLACFKPITTIILAVDVSVLVAIDGTIIVIVKFVVVVVNLLDLVKSQELVPLAVSRSLFQLLDFVLGFLQVGEALHFGADLVEQIRQHELDVDRDELLEQQVALEVDQKALEALLFTLVFEVDAARLQHHAHQPDPKRIGWGVDFAF